MSLIRFALIAGNQAIWTGRNIAAAEIHRGRYAKVLEAAEISYLQDDLLSLDNQPSNYIGASNAVKRNNIILEVEEQSTTKSIGQKLQIELIDVKIKVNDTNTILSTALINRRGSVKEYIQANDSKVTIKGSVIANSVNAFPVNELVALRKILNMTGVVKVRSKYLELLGITRLVVKTVDYDQDTTKYANTLNFIMTFESDEDYSFTID
jgi:hypothetical protein